MTDSRLVKVFIRKVATLRPGFEYAFGKGFKAGSHTYIARLDFVSLKLAVNFSLQCQAALPGKPKTQNSHSLTFGLVKLFAQYLVAALSARRNGIRLVQNVLAIEAVENINLSEDPSS